MGRTRADRPGAAWIFALACAGCPRPEGDAPRDAGGVAPPTVAQTADATTYRLAFEGRRQHHVDVEVAVTADGREAVTFMMPTWTPGSYLVREFARNVEGVRAYDQDGASLPVEKIAKNRWRVTSKGRSGVKLAYRVYARELSVRASHVSAHHAILNGASIFVADVDHLARSHRVRFESPWPDVQTALDVVDGAYVASDYDTLVDAPILLGAIDARDFEAGGARYTLATVGGSDDFDTEKATEDVAKIAAVQAAFWGHTPFARYVFLNGALEARGGLEHGASTLLMTSRFTTRDEEAYRGWLSLASHELFHAWNGKRLRPAALGPFDYEGEVYTEDLWFVEGVTSYYDDLFVARAGLMTEREWLAALSRNITSVETRPGRRHQSLAESSYDAWIKFYRSDENSDNATVSYYGQGAVVAFLADAAIRRSTSGERSLDDVMREAYRRHSGEQGYTSEALFAVFESVGGPDVRARLERMVRTTEPLEYDEAFALYGLELEEPKEEAAGYLGVATERTNVARVVRGSPAYNAGIEAGDEVIAFDEDRVVNVADDLKGRAAGTKVKVLVARHRRLETIEVELGVAPRKRYEVVKARRASATATRRLERLLTPR